MGICKCKNTTDLYCFTHGCHVCERCVADENGEHQKCYVRKYVDYINDSTFTPPVCGHCHKLDADDGAQSPLVRLPCFDVVHLGCLDAAGVEATSAQTPVKCPLCGADVFPKGATRASPIMAALCRVLKDSPWAAALVAGVPSAAPAAPAAPHAKPSIPKATDVPIPPVSSASISLPPPPASSTSPFGLLSNGDAQIELNVTREDDSSSSYAVDKTSGTSGMSTRKNVGGRSGDYSVTDAIERMEEDDEYEEEKYHGHTCSQILYYFGIGRESNGKVTIDYTKILFVIAIIGILFYLVSLANGGQGTEPNPDVTTN